MFKLDTDELNKESNQNQENNQIKQIIEMSMKAFNGQPVVLLPILHELQNTMGYISETVITLLAEALNLSRADVYGVVSFYHDFRHTTPGKYIVHLCRAESCQAMGMNVLEQFTKQTLDIDYHQTTEDGMFSLEPVYCLGNCACSPSVKISNQVYSDMNPHKMKQLLDSLRVKTNRVDVL
ncbi:MAG: formate dehydrogenase subunit gamma [Gammaproteobacteria bacterium]|nr:formate dehydrogenase subunit gamma [Gammaproteobacteria bacterium]